MRFPSVELAVSINAAVRDSDEWFADDEDDLPRLTRALHGSPDDDVVAAAARLASRVAHTRAFSEGNKRTAFLLAVWMLENNGVADSAHILPPLDPELGDLLVQAAAGVDVEDAMVALLRSRG